MKDILKRNNVRVFGEGKQPMLFAHGYGCDQNVWTAITPEFEKEYQLIVFDYVGAGCSDLSAYDEERYSTLNGYAKDVLEICDALSLKEVIFIGHSVSAMIGVLAANDRPEIFSKLVFLGPSPRYINDEGYVSAFERDDLEGLFEMMDNNYLGWSQALAPQIIANPERPQLGQTLSNSFCATDPEIAKRFARVTFLSDNRADLEKLSIPSLTLQCAQDIIAPMAVGEYVQAHTPHNQLIILNATGHCSHMSAPEETVAAIKSFI